MTDKNPRSTTFRAAITKFINERYEAKKGEKEDPAIAAKYDYANWLADAARRVEQIQAVTHVLKATHPDARGSSFHLSPSGLPQHTEIGTHTLGKDCTDDIVGNAAALDVYKFLKIELYGLRLLDWFLQDDPDLLKALHEDGATAVKWANAFKSLIRPVSTLVSHDKAKQVYWCHSGNPADDMHFHLLQPLFSSSLEDVVHAEIRDALFGEENTVARKSFWNKEKPPEGTEYRKYPNLIVRKLGGTKPQNISQLNSERGGVNYLLASLPPKWRAQPHSFLNIDSILKRFQYYENVHNLTRELCRFLKTDPPLTMETRIKRERIEKELGQLLASFGLEIQVRQKPGWTRNEKCKFYRCEKLWLDPERARQPPHPNYKDEDETFIHEFEWKDWPDEVATLFAYWLNDILRKAGLPVGDIEFRHWARQAIVEVTDWPATVKRRTRIPSDVSREPFHD